MDTKNVLTSHAVIREMGAAVKDYRINRSLTQQDLADASGVSLRSISRFEQGNDIQLGSLIKILKALGLLDNINLLIPDVTKVPSYYLKKQSPKRFRKRKTEDEPVRTFRWGDEL